MITSRSKWRPANRSFMPLNSLIVGPFLPNHYCNPLALAICTRAEIRRKSNRHFQVLPPRIERERSNFKTDSVVLFELTWHTKLCHRRPSCLRSMQKSRAHAPSPHRIPQKAHVVLRLHGSADPIAGSPQAFPCVQVELLPGTAE